MSFLKYLIISLVRNIWKLILIKFIQFIIISLYLYFNIIILDFTFFENGTSLRILKWLNIILGFVSIKFLVNAFEKSQEIISCYDIPTKKASELKLSKKVEYKNIEDNDLNIEITDTEIDFWYYLIFGVGNLFAYILIYIIVDEMMMMIWINLIKKLINI